MRMRKRGFEIMLSDDYTAQNTWRIAESIEAKSHRRGCNAAIVRPSVSLPLSVWLNVSLSLLLSLFYFYTFLFFSFFFYLSLYSSYCTVCLSFLICSCFSFCLLCLLSLQISHSTRYYIFFSWNPRNPSSCSYLTIRFS